MSRYAMCPRCGHRMKRKRDSFGDWDGETYICEYCAEEGEGCDSISVYDAALIWASNGKESDYTCGYSEDELEEALNN